MMKPQLSLQRHDPVMHPRRPRGVALLLVLWLIALLALLLGGFVVVARGENLQTRFLFDTTRARYAAESGLSRAAYELRRGDPLTRWVADGRPYKFKFEDAEIELRMTDESGKVDINASDETVLLPLLLAIGLDEQRAGEITDAIIDWRDPDDLVRAFGAEDAEYDAAQRDYGAADAPFNTIGELQQVLGMDYDLYVKLEPYITVYTRSPKPNPAFASALVLRTLPGITPEIATQLVQQRQAQDPGQLAGAPIVLPDGTPLVVGGGGLTYTVLSRATLPNGAWTALDTTLRLGGVPGGRAYTVLRWREGSTDSSDSTDTTEQ
jgi:general secretion pathway protein K